MASRLKDRLLQGARGAATIGWTAAMLAAVESHKAIDRTLADGRSQEPIFERYMRTWTGGLQRMLGVDLRIVHSLPTAHGLPRAQARRARMIIANHRSALDIPILLTHFGGSVLARGDMEHWPLLGLAAQKAQTIFVDRESSHSGAQAIRAMRDQLERGRTVIVFPEGTTFSGDEVRPFNAGAFVACRRLDVELVPVGLAYPPGFEYVEANFLDHAKAIAARPRTPVVMVVGESRVPTGKTAELAESLRSDVQALVHRARALT
jgi:1-acyl-sn-glycerol-3-phosphate acyltransferase